MWDNIEIKTKGDLHHYMNNALGVLSLDAMSIKHRAEVYDSPTLAGIAERIESTRKNLTLVRDELCKQLPD